MKLTLVTLLTLLSVRAEALERYCRVTKVFDSSFLEGSLNSSEFPDVIISDGEVTLGSSLFSVTTGDLIRLTPSMGLEKNLEIIQDGDEIKFYIAINESPKDKTGTLSGQAKGEPSSKIADLDCK